LSIGASIGDQQVTRQDERHRAVKTSDTEHGPEVRQRRARVGVRVGDDLIKSASCERCGGRHGDAASAELSLSVAVASGSCHLTASVPI